MLELVPWELLPQRWPQAKPYVQAAMERGDLGLFADVEHGIKSGRMRLWAAWRGVYVVGAGVTMIEETECSRPCVIIAAGCDDLQFTLPLLRRVEEYAKEQGCDCVRLFGRKGWSRVLPDYREIRTVLERRI